MKKIIFAFSLLFILHADTFAQDITGKVDTSSLVNVPIAVTTETDSLFKVVIDAVNTLGKPGGATVGEVINKVVALYNSGKTEVDGIDSVTDLQRLIDALKNNLPALLIALVTALFGFIKKDPTHSVEWLRAFFAKFKTKWVVVALSLVASVTYTLAFDAAGFSWGGLAINFVGAFFGSLGVANFSTWLGKFSLVKKKTE